MANKIPETLSTVGNADQSLMETVKVLRVKSKGEFAFPRYRRTVHTRRSSFIPLCASLTLTRSSFFPFCFSAKTEPNPRASTRAGLGRAGPSSITVLGRVGHERSPARRLPAAPPARCPGTKAARRRRPREDEKTQGASPALTLSLGLLGLTRKACVCHFNFWNTDDACAGVVPMLMGSSEGCDLGGHQTRVPNVGFSVDFP